MDHFILSRLEREGLEPSPDADRVTLIRRLSFDLTGLPPTIEQVQEFLEDRSAQAHERLVDRLLGSEGYGERMAVYWLDLVRYADSVGYHGDQEHSISPYRDYVIDAFNENLPFDQFTREQLAGDLLTDSGTDQKIASSYNRLLQTSHEGGVQPREYLAMYAADRVRNVSSVWMAATMGCCQCHDHKFDPLTMKDFYSMQAFFSDIDEDHHLVGKDKSGLNGNPTRRDPQLKVLTKRERGELNALAVEIDRLEQELDQLSSVDDEKHSQIKARISAAQSRRDAIEGNARSTMITVSVEPRTIRILPRGNWLDESGPIVDPAVPATLGQINVDGRRLNRLDLANWLTDAHSGVGGLTARVMVNRLWYLLFGRGIANDLADFSGQGEPPIHPRLLDHLALELVESGWDVKRLLKQLAMSRAYRQSSLEPPELVERDPYNQLFARQSRFRLPAEMIRDNALAVSGLLVQQTGGGSVRPYQPAGYYRHLNFPQRTYEHQTDEGQWRRGVYVHWQRQFLHPMLRAFDAPRREECTAQRPQSNTPIAVLTLLNDPTFSEAARVFADRILRKGGETTDTRLDYAFRLAVSRPPDPEERRLLKELFAADLSEFRSHPEAASKVVSIGQAPLSQELDGPLSAAWAGVARALLSTNETTTRN